MGEAVWKSKGLDDEALKGKQPSSLVGEAAGRSSPIILSEAGMSGGEGLVKGDMVDRR